MQDTSVRANNLVSYLAPFLPYLSGAIDEQEAIRLGRGAWSRAQRLWASLQPILEADPIARQATLSLAREPGDLETQALLRQQFTAALDKHPIALEEIPVPERMSVARALAQLGRKAEAAAIQSALASDGEVQPQLRVGAAESLAELGRIEEAAPILLALARHGSIDMWIRRRAAEALGRFRRVRELLDITRDRTVAPWVRECAMHPLRELGESEAVAEAWLGIAQDARSDRTVQSRALNALQEMRRGDKLLALTRDRHVHPRLREDAIRALGKLERAEELLALACDPSVIDWARVYTTEVLGDLGRVQELAALAKADGVLTVVRVHALRMLGRLLPDRAASDALHALARDETLPAWVRTDAAREIKRAAQDGRQPSDLTGKPEPQPQTTES